MRHVLFIPRDQIEQHLASQKRKDVKVVVPSLLSAAEAHALREQGRDVRAEVRLESNRWGAAGEGALAVCEAVELELPTAETTAGLLCVSFALPGATQKMHVHDLHWEMFYAESALDFEYRLPGSDQLLRESLPEGGLALFGPGVAHRAQPSGLMLVVEVPSVQQDKREV